MDYELKGKVDEIKRLVAEKEADELEAAQDLAITSAMAGGGIPVIIPPEDILSMVDVDALFDPFVKTPSPTSRQFVVDKVSDARGDVTRGWNELVTQLAANSVNWTGDAGDAFNRYVSRLTYASWEHTVLLGELEGLYTTYKELLTETRAAAHDFADKTKEALENIDTSVSIDWSKLINLAITIVAIAATEVAPPAGAALLLTRGAAAGSFLMAGKDALEGVSIQGNTVKRVMDSVQEAGEKLLEGVRAKAQVLADLLNETPGLIAANASSVMPPSPVIPQD